MSAATPEHRAAIHALAADLRKSGKSVWPYKLIIEFPKNADFNTKRSIIASSLESSRWFRAKGEDDSELWWIWDELKDADNMHHLELCVSALYDLADYDRCWIEFRETEEN